MNVVPSSIPVASDLLCDHGNPSMDAHAVAHATEGVELLYQPQVAWPSRRILGVEALVRLRDPRTQQLLPPPCWLPSIEATSQMFALGATVIHHAIAAAARWHAAGRLLSVGINIAAAQVMDSRLPDCVDRALREHPTAVPELIDFEVTETRPLTDLKAAAATLRGLRALGCGVSIDDFGSGFNNFQWLRALPITALKVDRSFVSGLLTDSRDAAIVEACMRIARAFDVGLIAEGVESEAVARRLGDIGYEQLQGFLFHEPLPAATVSALCAVAERPRSNPRSEMVPRRLSMADALPPAWRL